MSEPHVLVVDDHCDILELYTTYLSLEGFSVAAASDAKEALALSTNGVEVIATDLAMPGMDGVQLIREIRALRARRQVPIVVVTGEADDRLEAQLAEIGSCRLLRKPCELPHLAATLRFLVRTCTHDCARCPNRRAA